MLDLLYDLSPDEGIHHVEGHLLVLLLGADALSAAVADDLEYRTARLDDSAEFRLACVSAEAFGDLNEKASELPALFHFLDGDLKSRNQGADECVEFFVEFVDANRCKKNGKRR